MTRLVVIGDVLLDRDVDGTVERVCPDSPAPVVDVRQVRERPGGAGLAALLATQDDLDTALEVDLVTALADDPAGRAVRAGLPARVRVHALLPAGPTVGKTRVRAGGQCLVRLDDAGHLLAPSWLAGNTTASDTTAGELGAGEVAALDELLVGADAVLVADYGGGVTSNPQLRAAVERHAPSTPVVWDPHPRGSEPVRGTRVVTPNAAEARGRLGAGPAARPDDTAPRLRELWQVGAVAVTDGAAGVVVAEGTGVARVRASACPAGTDTCGAGDRFAVALAAALARGADVVTAAQHAAQVVSGWLAAGGVSADAPAARGAPPEDVVAAVRERGGTVVATGGCFDVLHAGHLELLRAARAQGDCLLVLVNSDDGVRRLKGPTRPVNPASERVRLLEALEMVDAVAVFEDDTPVATLERLRPDVWVKGGDYRADDLPEAPVVRGYGGRVHVVPLLAGRSTSGLLARVAAGSPAVQR